MVKIRLGKDIGFSLPVLTNGQATSLSGRDINVVLIGPGGIVYHPACTTSSNVVSFSFPGTDQTKVGIYRITVWENLGKGGETAVDKDKAFELVPSTEQESGTTTGLTTATVNLSSVSMEVGIKGESAYETAVRLGYTGTEQQWLASLKATALIRVENETIIIE